MTLRQYLTGKFLERLDEGAVVGLNKISIFIPCGCLEIILKAAVIAAALSFPSSSI